MAYQADSGKILKYATYQSQEAFALVNSEDNGMYSCIELIKPEGSKFYQDIRSEYTAEWELFRTPKEVKVNKNQIKQVYPLLNPYEYQINKGYIVRQTYDPSSGNISPQDLPLICLCRQQFNPDTPFEYCPNCKNIFHRNCLSEPGQCPDCSFPFKRQRMEMEPTQTQLRRSLSNNSQQSNGESYKNLPIDITKYQYLSEESKERLAQRLNNVQQEFNSSYSTMNAQDKIRNQIKTKIASALHLAYEENFVSGNILQVDERGIMDKALEIEAALFIFSGQDANKTAYKSKVRTVVFNLCMDKNPDFRSHLLKGEITTSQLCQMQSRDMASSAVKQLRENRQKKYEEEQLVCPTETAKLMVKTHKGEAVIEVDYEAPIDNPENNELETKVPDVEENQEDDPFNPETYSYEEEGYNNQEGIDQNVLIRSNPWLITNITSKLEERLNKFPAEMSERIMSHFNFLSLDN